MRELTDGRRWAASLAPVAGQVALGLAVSGGPDSLAMMLIVARWAAELPSAPRLVVYTLDHGLRHEAAEEAAMVAREAARLGLACRVLRWAGPHPASGVQAAARRARYRLIGQAMRADGVSTLLTAHHADDQAETVLMRMAHGSGLAGLAGIAAFSEIEGIAVFRPFLGVPGAELRNVLEGSGMVPARDPGNIDPTYERVRWRAELPRLAGLGLDAGRIGELARRLGEAESVLARLADEAFSAGIVQDVTGAHGFSRRWFAALAPAIATRVLQAALNRSGGGHKGRELQAVEALRDRLSGPGPIGESLHACLIKSTSDRVSVMREPGRGMPAPMEIEASMTQVWDNRFVVKNGGDRRVQVRMAGDWTRARAENFVGSAIVVPVHAIRSAPVVAGADGEVLAFGLFSRDPGLVLAPIATTLS